MNFTKTIAFFLLNIFTHFAVNSQQFSNIYFSSLPQNYQLFPRNNKNESVITVNGFVSDSLINKVSLMVTKNGKLSKYTNQIINFKNKKGPFEFNNIIAAELSEYDFTIYAHKSKSDSSLVVLRKSIVSGDVFVVTGESNAYYGYDFPDVYKGEFARSFGVFTDKNNTANYNPADTLWCVSNTNKNAVGFWASELQKMIIENQKIPVCIINGGSGGSSSDYNSIRNNSKPTDLSNAYGRLLYKLQKAKIINNIKGFFYRQGENEAISSPTIWQASFDKIYANLKMDLPSSMKIYLFQNDIYDTENKLSGVLREHQRQTKYRYPGEKNITVLATMGTIGFQGLNYSALGYRQTAAEVYKIINCDFYGGEFKDHSSPNVEKILYDKESSEVILIFEEHQEMEYPEPFEIKGSTIFIEEFLQLENATLLEISGRADKNRVIIKVKEGFSGKKMSYMLPFFIKGTNYIPLLKPLITNKNGLRALSFENFPIVDALLKPQMTARKKGTTIEWKCPKIPGATYLKVEMKANDETKFSEGPTIKVNETGIYNMNLSKYFKEFSASKKFQFRFKAIGDDLLESSYTTIIPVNYEVGAPNLTDIKTIGLEQVELNWESDYDDPNYKYIIGVSFYNKKAFYEIEPVGFPAKSAIIKNLFQGNRYFFRIRAYNDTLGLFSNYSINGIGSTWIVQPTQLKAEKVTTNSATLDWKYDIEANIDNFGEKKLILEHSTDGKNFKELMKLPETDVEFSISGLNEATKQYYRIYVRREDDIVSNWSNVVLVYSLPLKPTNLTGIAKTIKSIDLNWEDNSNGETGYQIWVSKNGEEKFEKLISLPPNTTKYTASKLIPGTEYKFKVLAEVTNGVSEFSDEAKLTTLVITGSEAPITNQSITVFPNPAQNNLYFNSSININEPIKVSVFMGNGKMIYEKKFSSISQKNDYELPIKDLQLGIYYIEIRSKKRKVLKKFVKN
jgi:hypothetical protein